MVKSDQTWMHEAIVNRKYVKWFALLSNAYIVVDLFVINLQVGRFMFKMLFSDKTGLVANVST